MIRPTHINIFQIICGFLGSLIVLFILLPLLTTIIQTTPAEIGASLADAEVVQSLILTFAAGVIATALGTVTGVPLAYLLARLNFKGKRVLEGFINLPVIIPHTAAGISLLMVFGRRGILGEMFEPIGLYFTDSLAGVVVAMMFVSIPFVVNSSREAFKLVDVELEQVAYLDGASQFQAFWLVALPLAWRGVASGATMMWARGVSEFGTIAILAYHPKTMPVLVYERFVGFGLNQAKPLTVILIFTALALFVLAGWRISKN